MPSAETPSPAPEKESDRHHNASEPDVERSLRASAEQHGKGKILDSNVVDFDGPDDMYNPMNWSTGKKATTILFVTLMTILS